MATTLKARPVKQFDPQDVLCRADLNGESCWNWLGYVTHYGYGTYGHDNYMAHRIVYELFNGQLDEEMFLDHLCRNRKCVNPEHLEPVTLVENVMRGESIHAKNARKTHCKHGHKFTVANTYIDPKNNRQCRKCRALSVLKYTQRKKGTLNWHKI